MSITKELILRREDGSRVKITAHFYVDGFRGCSEYRCEVYICQPKKRTFVDVVDGDCFRYRKLSMEHRVFYKNKKHLDYVSKEELLEAKKAVWQMLNPELLESNPAYRGDE